MKQTKNITTLCQEMAQTPSLLTLENLYQKHWRELGPRLGTKFHTAMTMRAWELLALHPNGNHVPYIERTRGQYVVTYLGQTYKSGRAGNGAGLRWIMCELVEWVHNAGGFRRKKSKYANVSDTKAKTVVDLVLSGYPHRALRWAQPRATNTPKKRKASKGKVS